MPRPCSGNAGTTQRPSAAIRSTSSASSGTGRTGRPARFLRSYLIPLTAASTIQLLRTYPARRPGYPFAPAGERSVARGYAKVLARARSLVYLEDQYLWSSDVAQVFADALRREQQLRVIAVIPRFPDQDGRTSLPPNLVGRTAVLQQLSEAGGERFAVYGLENQAGTPIYVHAKVCVVDDTWATVGSDNANRRSWTHDSELSCAVFDPDPDPQTAWPGMLRLRLAAEHLGGAAPRQELCDPIRAFELFRESANRLDLWHASGSSGPRPPGQLRAYTQPELGASTRLWATPMYRLLYDPDARGLRMRLRGDF